jgi:two-component system NtrC family response regulator
VFEPLAKGPGAGPAVSQSRLLIVEDDEAIQTQLKYALRDEFSLILAGDRPQALARLREAQPPVVTLDLGLPPAAHTAEEGLKTLEEILRAAPSTRVVVLTGNADRANALRAVQAGAFDYQAKPVDIDALRIVLRRALFLHGVETEAAQQVGDAEASARFEDLVGHSPKMREIFDIVTRVARTDATVLVEGESGTGKELLAHAVHAKSRRRDRPFVPINCGAIPETLLEAELFGHERGAYTGAHVQRKGKLEGADGGTLFLDEIGEMSLLLQVKLLRFLQEREIERIGGRDRIKVDVRVVGATNKNLKAEIAGGRFREDLYFRLSVVTITLPPLRERGEDIILLANTLLRRNCQDQRRKLQFSQDALMALAGYAWPGNIRELENVVQRAVIMARGKFIEPADLGFAAAAGSGEAPRPLKEARNQLERELLLEALTRTKGNISQAAKELGVSRPTLHDLLDKHEIDSRTLRPSATRDDA